MGVEIIFIHAIIGFPLEKVKNLNKSIQCSKLLDTFLNDLKSIILGLEPDWFLLIPLHLLSI